MIFKKIPEELDGFDGDLVISIVGKDEVPLRATNAWLDWQLRPAAALCDENRAEAAVAEALRDAETWVELLRALFRIERERVRDYNTAVATSALLANWRSLSVRVVPSRRSRRATEAPI